MHPPALDADVRTLGGVPARPAAGAVAATIPGSWGVAELFVVSQTAIPALLYLSGTQAIRLYVRIASFAIALAVLGWVVLKNGPRARPHPARPWLIAALAYVSLMVLHPLTSSTTAGLAQVVLYLSVIAPLFWAPAVIRDPDHAARLMGLLLVCNGVNALVGVLQVYDPGRWMPQEVSRIVTESAFGLGAVTYQGPNGLIVRPPGLFDNPGAVAGPGMYAALLGVVFAMSAAAPWKRALALGASFAGIAAIYLSHVRVSLVVCLVMLASYVAILVAQNRRMRAARVAGTALVLVVATFAFALALGGRSIGERTSTLVETDPLTLYSASRGNQLVYTFDELLTGHPLGAGLGRWGMVGGYFGRGGNPESTPLWAEIQITGWAIDGGLPLLVLSLAALALTLQSQRRVALRDPDAKVRACAAVALAANLGTAALVFSFTPFVTQIGVQFWFLAGAVHGIATRAVRHQ